MLFGSLDHCMLPALTKINVMKKKMNLSQLAVTSFYTSTHKSTLAQLGGVRTAPVICYPAKTNKGDQLGTYCPNPLGGPSGNDTNGD